MAKKLKVAMKKSKCPECGGAMKGGKCAKCGYEKGSKKAAGKKAMPWGK